MVERVAWFWTDWVGQRSLGFVWSVAIGLLALMYGGGFALAALAGDGRAFVDDLRWLSSYLIVAACAVQLVLLPRAITRLWESLRPVLARPDTDIPALQRDTRRWLARFFPLSVMVWAAFIAAWIVNHTWDEYFHSRWLSPALTAMFSGLFCYFIAGAAVFSSVGLWSTVRHVTRDLQFRPGALVGRGRAALKPFNQVLWCAWIYSMVVVALTGVGTKPISGRVVPLADVILWIVLLLLISLLYSAQRAMDRLLAREKARDLASLREQIDEERSAGSADSIGVLRSLHRVQLLLDDLRRAEAFQPTLADTHFVVQIGLSVTATLIANVLLRTVISRLVQP